MAENDGAENQGERAPKGPPPGPAGIRNVVLFTEGPVRHHIKRMSVPMLWGMMATVAAALADTYFLAQLGTAHLAAITFTFPVVMLFMSLTLGLASGFSSLLARALGEGDTDKVHRLTVSTMLLAGALVLFFSVLGFFTIDPLFTALGAGPSTLPLVRDYMSIWYFAMIFLVFPLIGNFALRASGNPKAASFVMITSAAVHALLDPIFIFGFWFIPAMGIEGAALAGVFSRVASFIATFYILVYRNKLITFDLPSLPIILDAWKSVLRIGGPLAMTNMVTPFSAAIITFLLAQHGETTVAGFGVAARIEALAVIPLIAVGSSLSPIAGQNYGAEKYDRIVEAIKEGFVFIVLYGLACTLLLAVFHEAIPALFDSNAEVVHTAGLFLLVVPIGYIGMGVAMVVGASFTGMGNPRPSVVMSLSRLAVVYLPVAILGGWLFGPVGIFAASSISNLLVAAGAVVFVAWQARRAVAAGNIKASGVRYLLPGFASEVTRDDRSGEA
jgi:putative MATE family efflux protein